MKVLINISYCASHQKGNENNQPVDGAEHAEWLEECVNYHLKWTSDGFVNRTTAPGYWPIVVSMTGFPGLCHVEAGRERDAYWRIFNHERVRLVTMPQNPSHQVGAAWCIRQGLEMAGKCGYDIMIHTAEDVMPGPGVMLKMVKALAECDYVGERWGMAGTQLNSQFFGCRVQSLVPLFDAPNVADHGCLENYLAWLLRGRPVCLGIPGPLYRHTHDRGEWQRWLDEARRQS